RRGASRSARTLRGGLLAAGAGRSTSRRSGGGAGGSSDEAGGGRAGRDRVFARRFCGGLLPLARRVHHVARTIAHRDVLAVVPGALQRREVPEALDVLVVAVRCQRVVHLVFLDRIDQLVVRVAHDGLLRVREAERLRLPLSRCTLSTSAVKWKADAARNRGVVSRSVQD